VDSRPDQTYSLFCVEHNVLQVPTHLLSRETQLQMKHKPFSICSERDIIKRDGALQLQSAFFCFLCPFTQLMTAMHDGKNIGVTRGTNRDTEYLYRASLKSLI